MIQLLILFITALLCITLATNKWVRLVLIALYTLFISLQGLSLYMNATVIDYSFYEHIHLNDVFSVLGAFKTEASLFFLSIILVAFLLYKGALFLSKRLTKKIHLILPLLICVGVMTLPNGIIYHIYDIYTIKHARVASITKSLHELGFTNYVAPQDIEASPGKNIIVLSLESLEAGFLEPPFKHLTPHLQKLKEQYHYQEVTQNKGSGWTSASMYSLMTGLPAFFKASGNDIFQSSSSYNITTLPTVLHTAGYTTKYLLAKKEFSGINDMLNTLGVEARSEKDFTTSYPSNPWGLHDKDLFEEAKKEIISLKSKEQPFALFLSTISTHFPDGIYDSRFENILPKQPSDLEFMVSAIDYMVGDFFDFLNKEKLLNNTTVIIVPDHLFMGNSSAVVDQFKNARHLYVISTDAIPATHDIQLDLPRTVIESAGLQTNARFLTDHLKESNKEQFVQNHKKELLSLNEAALKTLNFKEGFTLTRKDNNTLELKSNDHSNNITLDGLTTNETYLITFDQHLRFLKKERLPAEKAFKHKNGYQLIYSLNEDDLFAQLQSGPYLGIAKTGSKQIKIAKEELAVFTAWNTLAPKPTPSPSSLVLKSSAYQAFQTSGLSEMHTGLLSHKPTRGLNLITVNGSRFSVKAYDTFGSQEEVQQLINKIKKLQDTSSFFAIVGHDSSAKMLRDFKDELKALGFPKLAQLNDREAYIAHVANGKISEYQDKNSVTQAFPLPEVQPLDLQEILKDNKRFIAHAGGEIDRNRYTNSLEALDLNYSKGFRLFELDIITTSDGQFAAAHDWKIWREHTGYENGTPDLKTFKSLKIKEKYTPLDMKAINAWFGSHPDAVLVTDKINTPKTFAQAFTYKDRLMMELFSLDAVKEARAAGVKPIVSENVLNALGDKKVEKLNALGVGYVALSRKQIAKRAHLLQELQEAGIKAYVYHVNFEAGKDENYVLQYELPYVYGMYADRWKFDPK